MAKAKMQTQDLPIELREDDPRLIPKLVLVVKTLMANVTEIEERLDAVEGFVNE